MNLDNPTMVSTEAPILSRLDRIDNMLRQLEEIRTTRSPKSLSSPSSPSSGTLTSDGHGSSVDFSPKSLEKHCRPIDRVVMETELKGTLIDRLDQLENRLMKMEGELEAEKHKEEEIDRKAHKKGFKNVVKRVIKGKRKT